MVYPQGTSFPKRWNAGATWGAAVDDVQFFRHLLDDLSTVATVDRSRVYVDGFSNGGGMAVRIACEAAEEVAAIGTVAGFLALFAPGGLGIREGLGAVLLSPVTTAEVALFALLLLRLMTVAVDLGFGGLGLLLGRKR